VHPDQMRKGNSLIPVMPAIFHPGLKNNNKASSIRVMIICSDLWHNYMFMAGFLQRCLHQITITVVKMLTVLQIPNSNQAVSGKSKI